MGLAWPGVALFDTVRQFEQIRSGTLDDWHPPVMARLWSLFLRAGIPGTASLFVVQTLLFYAGLALLFGAVPRWRRGVIAGAVIALVIPADWLTVVVKDAQMIAALTAATGLVAAFRLRHRPLPAAAVAAVAVLLGYAVLLRANAVFAVAPLALAWAGWGGVRSGPGRAALLLAATAAVLVLGSLVNHDVFAARASHVERVLPIYDLAGIAHFGGLAPPRVTATAWAAAARGCYSPYLWDALGDDRRCGAIGERIGGERIGGDGQLFGDWARAIIADPRAYARHRLAHLNATLRWLVPWGQPNAAAPPDSQPNAAGLGGGGTWRTRGPARLARAVAATPLGWPAVWLAASLGLWAVAAGTPRGAARDLALSLFVSASLGTLSFVVVSIASDLRYHLWAMVATALGGIVLSTAAGVPRRRVVITATVVAIVAGLGLGARINLPTGAWG